jgi:phosphoribosyl-ATP pyrophosphohydrolase/phosphoribosyl-AMP cyclohydrolase
MTPDELWATLTPDARGLVPAVCVDRLSGAVLMVAYCDRAALTRTLTDGFATFYSRSRQRLWRKGEESGHTLAVREVRADCDGDCLLLVVTPAGPTCHTGRPSCFFRRRAAAGLVVDEGPAGGMVTEVERVVAARCRGDDPRSYTRSLCAAGWPRILAKIDEEAHELMAALPEDDDAHAVHEAADLLFHVLVALQHRGLPWRAVLAELERRFGVSGLDEKAGRPGRREG